MYFYVGFPQANERFEILKLHANRFDSRYSQGDNYFPLTQQQWGILLSRTQNFTGAELQALVEITNIKFLQTQRFCWLYAFKSRFFLQGVSSL